jgi:hypothetical protein
MPLPEQNHLRQFLLFVFVLLIPCFALWSFLGAALATPVIGLAHLILSNWFPDIVNVVYQDGADAMLMTRLDQVNGQLVKTDVADAGLGFKVNTRIISYSIPFYAALHFATEKRDYLANFFWGLLVIYPFILLGLVSICLKDLMVSFGSTFLEQPGVFVPGADVIGIAYQLNVLLVPTLVPILVWAWQSRQTPLLRGMLGSPATPTEETNP